MINKNITSFLSLTLLRTQLNQNRIKLIHKVVYDVLFINKNKVKSSIKDKIKMWQSNVTTSDELMTSSPDIFDLFLNRVIPIILSIVCLVGLFGNFIVVYLMRKVKCCVINVIKKKVLSITQSSVQLSNNKPTA